MDTKPDGAEAPEQVSIPTMPPPDLGLRVTQSQFARALGVSRQTVSVWKRRGIITVCPADGRLEFRRAVDAVLKAVDGNRARSPALKALAGGWQALVDQAGRVPELEALLAERGAALEAAQQRIADLEREAGQDWQTAENLLQLVQAIPLDTRIDVDADWTELVWDLFEQADAAARAEPAGCLPGAREAKGGRG